MTQRYGSWFGILALLIACASPANAAEDVHDSVVIVLDASGSMNEGMAGMFQGGPRKMEAAKAALKTVLHQVPASTHIGLLVFPNDSSSRWTYPLGPRDDARLIAAIDQIREGGGTPLGEYTKLGADRLLEERARQFGYGSYRLLVVTDGEATDGNLIDRVAPESKQRGLTLDVIGVAMPGNHALAKYAHTYRRADDPKSLESAVREVFAEVASGGDDAAGAEAYAALEGLDPGVAQGMIDAFAKTGNHPIGERPPEPKAEDPATDGSGGSSSSAPVVSPNGAPAQPGAVGCNCSGTGVDPASEVVIFLLCIALALMIARRWAGR